MRCETKRSASFQVIGIIENVTNNMNDNRVLELRRANPDDDSIGDNLYLRGEGILEEFRNNIDFVKKSMNINSDYEEKLIVVLYGYIVASIESYLYFKFYDKIINADYFEENGCLIEKWVESDEYFSKQKVALKDILNRNFSYFSTKYLKEIIYHKIEKIKPMYKAVLNVQFKQEDMDWLGNAIEIRHDCVHRAGYNKEGIKIRLEKSDLEQLINNSIIFIDFIESEMNKQ